LIFIVAKFQVDESRRSKWPSLIKAITDATRAEPGNLCFNWSQAHVRSDHFREGLAAMRPALSRALEIINAAIPWGRVVPDGNSRSSTRNDTNGGRRTTMKRCIDQEALDLAFRWIGFGGPSTQRRAGADTGHGYGGRPEE
jgi:quinol monooxygenase YgiN